MFKDFSPRLFDHRSRFSGFLAGRAMPQTGNGSRRVAFFLWVLLSLQLAGSVRSEQDYDEIGKQPHNYYGRTPADRVTNLKTALESGSIPLDRTGERAFVLSLLKALGVPASSQMLVFSTTSLQLRLISPRNPRALYFSEDVYLGFIPGGQIEVIALDPELGAVFYIFDIPKKDQPLVMQRSNRCMNCHAAEETNYVPGLVVKSVVPGPTGGSLIAFRKNQTGHAVPFEDRFGGWYVTGDRDIGGHWGNLIGSLASGELTRTPIEPGALFDFQQYPVATSDVLPQLVHEHQLGFVNRAVEASYRVRTHLHLDDGKLTAAHGKILEEQAKELARYLLFVDEASLPEVGIGGDPAFKHDFLDGKRTDSQGRSLKDFELRARLFRYRCSYMIYSPLFQGLPVLLKAQVYEYLDEALSGRAPGFEHIPLAERTAIRSILEQTLPDLADGWSQAARAGGHSGSAKQ